MNQNINLYVPFEGPPPLQSFLTWRLYGFLNIGFFLILALIFLYSLLKISVLSSEYKNQVKQSAALQQQFHTLKNQYPAFFFTQDVAQSVENIRKQFINQNKILTSIKNITPFSTYLITLGEVITPDTWLTSIIITTSGTNLSLTGKSLSLTGLQGFFDTLLKHPQFNKAVLNIKDIQAAGEQTKEGQIKFEINLSKALT